MRFALVGCGTHGQAYAAAASDLGLEVAVCADRRAGAAKTAAAQCGAKAATDCDRVLVLEDIDALLLCVPPGPRLGYLRRAAMHGKHVLCAGPLAHTAAPAGKALEAVRAARVALYVAHDGRAAPEEAALARQIDQGAVGSAGFVRIHRSGPARRGAGAIEAILPRDLDWLVRRFGPPARLFAHSVHRPGLSHASLTLTFASGPLVQWIATCGAPDRTLIEICGTAGMVQFTSDEAVLEVTPGGKGATPAYRVSPIAHGVQARHLVHFLASAERAGSEATCDHEFAIVRMVEAALRSARTGNEMRL